MEAFTPSTDYILEDLLWTTSIYLRLTNALPITLLRNVETPKTISSIEQALITARDSTTTLKFDGRLEPTVGSSTEIGKERFMTLLQRRVKEYGQETFYYMKNANDEVVNLLEHSHNFTLEMATNEMEIRMEFENTSLAAFDAYEFDDITLSRLVVESLLSSGFYEKIFIRFGHRPDFETLPGSCLLLMALETCNASVSHDIDGAATSFADLTLDSYPGEKHLRLRNRSSSPCEDYDWWICITSQYWISSPRQSFKNGM